MLRGRRLTELVIEICLRRTYFATACRKKHPLVLFHSSTWPTKEQLEDPAYEAEIEERDRRRGFIDTQTWAGTFKFLASIFSAKNECMLYRGRWKLCSHFGFSITEMWEIFRSDTIRSGIRVVYMECDQVTRYQHNKSIHYKAFPNPIIILNIPRIKIELDRGANKIIFDYHYMKNPMECVKKKDQKFIQVGETDALELKEQAASAGATSVVRIFDRQHPE